eukprot:SAG25_NODE_2495_length_1571_cov_1.680027_1_plen_163_part_00
MAPDTGCSTTQHTESDKDCQPMTTVVGYMGGRGEYPTYQNYTNANNYSETVRMVYDSSKLSYADILQAYWQYAPDPTMPEPDPAYQLRIFYVDEVQRAEATQSVAAAEKAAGAAPGSFLIEIAPASEYTFWKAEEYHQHYFDKSGQTCGNRTPLQGGRNQQH